MNLVRAIRCTLLSVAIFLGPLQSAPAQEWVKTSAPQIGWITVASSADGARVVAADTGTLANFTNRLVYTSTNAGTTWAPTTIPDSPWRGVASSADGLRLAALSGGRDIYLSTNAGASWTTSAMPYAGQSAVAMSADGMKLMVVGDGVSISCDFGATWTNRPGIPAEYVVYIACSADGSKLVTEAQGPFSPVYVSTNAGLSWFATSVTNDYPGGVAISANGATMVAASHTVHIGGPVYLSTNSGATWVTATAPSNYWECVTCSADGTTLAAVAGPGVYISTNSGATWKLSGGYTGWTSFLSSSADGCRLVLAAYNVGIYSYRTTPAPVLSMSPSGNNLVISWIIPSMPFSLQEANTLATPNWADLTNAPVLNYSTLRNEVTLPASAAARFYRLKSQ